MASPIPVEYKPSIPYGFQVAYRWSLSQVPREAPQDQTEQVESERVSDASGSSERD